MYPGAVPVTTVDIDKDLLEEAKLLLGLDTTRATIDQALREAVQRRRQLEAGRRIAALDLDPDPQRQPLP